MKDFVNPIWSSVAVPIAERLPCGLVVSVDDVCAIGEMFTIFVPPPRYSVRHPALGVVTPKCDFIISTYLVPPRASRSSSFCTWNACRSWLIVAAVASVRSAYKNGSVFVVVGPISRFVVLALKYVRPPDDVSAVIPPTPVTSLLMFTGADVPSGRSTESPFCGHGNADVK